MTREKKDYVSPQTNHTQMQLEQSLCAAASPVVKQDAAENAELVIEEQTVGGDQGKDYDFEYEF